ncbi:peptidase domain-containing ABC transporter [Chitinophaga qingshengii]|uniref:Peptidase domain-containing ABC transporter n=1 Tax=Chitinophaga qingshengii TaxID=1569794 RepID=A0ABR7TKS4_9BACT|nr:peptidase domain-containing ABC transporter [Chitinophaga qingshengii]MBC9930131.1 peptidase domain-containing ABC transporter [Chitinophaga qingshengii]
MSFPFYRQLNAMDCGPTCLRMIARHYGRHHNTDSIRQKTGFGKQGVSLLGISETAEKMGFRTRGVQVGFEKLKSVPMPAILHWNHNHFVVLVDIKRRSVKIADPARGIVSLPVKEFEKKWSTNKNEDQQRTGTALLLEPTPGFYETGSEKEKKLKWGFIAQYLKSSRWQLTQVCLALLMGMFLQLVMPFLTQSMVDNGINAGNMEYIVLVLFAQLMLTFSSTIISFIRSRLQMVISGTINISILSDFWIKLTRLPLSYYDSRHTGDTLQRISDNKQLQSFLTGQTLNTLFSMLNFAIYAVILIMYDINLFMLFAIGNILYFGWINIFMRFRRNINHEMFSLSVKEKNTTLELVQGMQEIRLNNAEQFKRWGWENTQVQLFKLDFKSLNYNQWQSAGALLITQAKDIVISFMVARLVVKGQLTFGAMLSIQYIIGQLSGPVAQFISLAQGVQDVKISMERLNEIHELEDEEPADQIFTHRLPEDKTIRINQLSFSYPGVGNPPVLEDIALTIPGGKITALVGDSGSGKTTILKLLLKIYTHYSGELKVGENNLSFISSAFWRRNCGAVLQDSYVFNDTIARNIAVGDESIDEARLITSCKIANILSFIETLPNGFNTKIGAEGIGISQGQRQRLFIARAVYKNPEYLFFDEATNALDSNNEKVIVENLNEFFEGKTVLIVAHRLSTVRNADKIVVLHRGKIVEEGTHTSLTARKGYYYELVKNQLELGK